MTETTPLAQTLAATVNEIPGVYALGDPVTRMIGVARTALGGRASTPGVLLDVDPPRLDIRVALVAEYPANVTALADTVRAALRSALAEHTGPLNIDVTITDVHGPFDVPLLDSEPEPELEPEPESESESTIATAPAPLVVGDPDSAAIGTRSPVSPGPASL